MKNQTTENVFYVYSTLWEKSTILKDEKLRKLKKRNKRIKEQSNDDLLKQIFWMKTSLLQQSSKTCCAKVQRAGENIEEFL